MDIVETGRTLAENGLAVKSEIVPVSARLIANKVSWKFKNDAIRRMARLLAQNAAAPKEEQA